MLDFTAPMVKVKQAVSRLEQELMGMDVQIGVIENALLQSQLRDRSYFANEMYADVTYWNPWFLAAHLFNKIKFHKMT